jgi:Mg-chelatase subunit ChlD
MLMLRAPLFLLLLIPLAVLALTIGPLLAGRRAGPRRRTVALVLRCACLCLLIVALAQPVWRQTTAAGAPVVFVVDTSGSISPAARGAELAWLRAALQRLPEATPRALVTFAGSSMLMQLPAQVDTKWLRDRLSSSAEATSTDIEQALRLALGALPDGGQIVLLSDGVQTTGEAQNVLPLASAHRVSIDTVAVPDDHPADAALTRLAAPRQAHEGDQIPLQIAVWSNRAADATLSVRQDGRAVGSQVVRLNPGNNPFLVNLAASSPGWHSYRAAIALRGDGVPQNNALDVVTDVSGPPRLLVVTANPRGSATAALLGGLGLSIHAVQSRSMPSTASAIESYDAVVLDDLPATALQAKQVAALDRAVRGAGVGLFVVGGPHSLTLGRYGQTPLERMLPVLSDTPNSLQQGNVALQLVMDRSGSMNDLAGQYPKILMAQKAASLGVDFAAQHKDDLGLVSFDLYTHLLLPMQKITPSSSGRVHAIVNAMTADGGTNIYDALRLGLAQVLRSGAPYKHIILMTDGRSDPASYDRLLALMQRDQVTLSAIGLGQDADTVLLQYLAARGKGRFYYTNDAADLPRIFAEEARISAGSARVTGNLGVVIDASSPLVRSLNAGTLPRIKGYPATVLKASAVADLVVHAQGHSADPVLAHWQYGLGRVAVWTPGGDPAWAATWVTQEPALWDDVARWLAREAAIPALTPWLQSSGDQQQIVVDTQQNSGRFVNLALIEMQAQAVGGGIQDLTTEEVGPGQYEALLPNATPGVYTITVQQVAGALTPVKALVAVPYAREYVPATPDQALLSQLAAETGGALLTTPRQIRVHYAAGHVTSDQDLWWGLAALALALFVADIALRQSDWGRVSPPA